MDLLPIILLTVFGGAALIAGGVLIDRHIRRKRSQNLQAAADGLNFTFSPEVDTALPQQLSHFHLFSQGKRRRASNVLRGRAGDLDVLIFDYRYTIGGGQNQSTYKQTIILFEGDDMRLPCFTLRPENVFHKIGQVFGYKDIDFDGSPEFSKRYLLRGENVNEVRGVFNATVLAHFETQQHVSTEADGKQLIYYRARKRIAPTGLADFVRQGVQVLTLFRR